MKKLLCFLLSFLLLFTSCAIPEEEMKTTEETLKEIHLSNEAITLNGNAVTDDESAAVYVKNDIIYYKDGQDLTYGDGGEKGGHSKDEADMHKVLHITKAGTYSLSGALSFGQVAIDLGLDAENEQDAVVTLILSGVDITCTVAPAIIFYNVYECCDKDKDNAVKDINIDDAGANIIIADNTENNIKGSYVAEIYKSATLNKDGTEVLNSEKLHKYDGAFYSRMSMNISGETEGNGVLNVIAENEGIDTELHLTINGGIINIEAGNDGINTNEDGVSVTTINDGEVNIYCNGKTGEGDGIDSNGYLVINGGKVTAQACGTSADSGIDSEKGIYLNGGSVMATGNMLDKIAGAKGTYGVMQFFSRQTGGGIYTLKDKSGEEVGKYNPKNDFTYLLIAGEEIVPGDYNFFLGDSLLEGTKTRRQMGRPQGQGNKWPNFGNMNFGDLNLSEVFTLEEGANQFYYVRLQTENS